MSESRDRPRLRGSLNIGSRFRIFVPFPQVAEQVDHADQSPYLHAAKVGLLDGVPVDGGSVGALLGASVGAAVGVAVGGPWTHTFEYHVCPNMTVASFFSIMPW
jgi:hypothetical protein